MIDCHQRNGSRQTAENAESMEAVKACLSQVADALDRTSEMPSDCIEDAGTPESGLKLDEFSMHHTPMLDRISYKKSPHLDLTSYPDALKWFALFSWLGRWISYPEILQEGEFGYQPELIREFELKNNSSADMASFGSGGSPSFLREYLVVEGADSGRAFAGAIGLGAARDSAQQQLQFLRKVQSQPTYLDKVAICKAAKSIQICWKVSKILGGDLGDWLLKIAVHTAYSMERRRHLGRLHASGALFRSSREIASLLQILVVIPNMKYITTKVGMRIVTICAMLTEAGFDFVSAGECLAFPSEPHKMAENLVGGIAESCYDLLTVAARVFAKSPWWTNLIKNRIRTTNFCTSRVLTVTLELHARDMFHLISRSQYITTARQLHSKCGDICDQAKNSEEKDYLPGHLTEECLKGKNCPTKDFTPEDTIELVLFDTVEQKLFQPKTVPPYVAVSQIWFQGIFGQESRTCGTCSLTYLGEACRKIGMRYAWIDTLCMPDKGSPRRKEVVEQMRDIYLKAKATLVVDAGLITTVARTTLDLSLAIWLSDWSSRVWTLQEGILSSKLLFCVGNDVLALPQVSGPDSLKNRQSMVSNKVLGCYGKGKLGLDLPLDVVLNLAAGRQTSRPQDYMYGLAALFPERKLERVENLGLIAKEVASMYTRVDLGILQASFDRCEIEKFRWMPKSAEKLHRQFDTGVYGVITPDGLRCPVTAMIKVALVASRPSGKSGLLAAEMDLNIKHWYTTEVPGVSIGACADAKHLIFCRVGDENDDTSYGFVVAPTGQRSVFQYIGGAAMLGKVPAKPMSILVT